MSRRDRQQLQLDLDMAHMAITSGDSERVFASPKDAYETYVAFVLPPRITKLVPGNYQFVEKEQTVNVEINLIESPTDDPLARHGGEMFVHSKQGFPPLTFSDLSDNRGVYPAMLVAVIYGERREEFEKQILRSLRIRTY